MNLIASILTFIIIYHPFIVGVSLTHLFLPIIYLYILVNIKGIAKYIEIRYIIEFILFLSMIIGYLLISAMIRLSPIQDLMPFIYFIIEVIPFCLVIVDLVYRKNGKFEDIIDILINIGIVQGLISMLAYLSDDFQLLLVSQLHSGSEILFEALSVHRLFGYSSLLTYSMPIVQVMIALIMIIKFKENKLKYSLSIPLLIFSGFINARTSFIVLAIGLAILLISSAKKNILKIIPVLILSLVLILFIFNINFTKFETNSNPTISWVITGIEETIGFFKGDVIEGQYFDYILQEENYQVPKGIGLVFGEGIRVLGGQNRYDVFTDVGYINDLWLGGIVYSFFVYLLFIRTSYISYKINRKISSNSNNFLIILFIFLTMFVVNIKGYIFGYNSVTNMLIIIYIAYIIDCYKENNNEKNISNYSYL